MQVRPQKRDNAALVKSLEESIDNLDALGTEHDPEKTTQRITLLSEEVNNADEAGKITPERSEKVLRPGHTGKHCCGNFMIPIVCPGLQNTFSQQAIFHLYRLRR